MQSDNVKQVIEEPGLEETQVDKVPKMQQLIKEFVDTKEPN